VGEPAGRDPEGPTHGCGIGRRRATLPALVRLLSEVWQLDQSLTRQW
jgi:hypothetical protein